MGRGVLPPVPQHPRREGARVLATPSPHDLDDEPGHPEVEQDVPGRQDDAERRRDRDHVAEEGQHVLVGHHVVLRAAGRHERALRSAGDPHGLRAHGHAGVRRDDREVQQEPDRHHEGGRDPSVQREEHEQQRVARDQHHRGGATVREPGDRRGGGDLEREPDHGQAPPVEADPLEVPEAAAGEEAHHERRHEDDQDR